jgi:putative CocE/NonD family hydrolase
MMTIPRTRLPAFVTALVLAAAPAAAQSPAPADSFVRREVMIPMRDGTQLFTVVVSPAGRSQALPIIFERTPYGAADLSGAARYFARELGHGGYIFAFQDIRGRNQSQGSFVMTRPPTGPVDETTDTWDAIDWLVKNVEGNNGRVGMFGVSYDGWLTDMALIRPHPALKAASPQASVGDFWMGDDFFHQGAFRLSYGLEYAWMMEASNDQSDLPKPTRFDTYDWYRSFPTLDSLARAVGAARWPTWRRFVEHPAWDSVWQNGALTTHLKHTTVPTLTVGGWWDQEDLYGPQATYRVREATDTAGLNQLVLGPWFHGQWLGDSGDSLGLVRFGSATGTYFRREVLAPWFAYHLKGEGDGRFPEARVFDAGAREWRTFDRWPPPGAVAAKLYLGANGRLSFTPPAGQAAADSFVSDPAHPVPYRPRPVEWTYDRRGSRWRQWMTEDQRFVDGRPDVLVWQTEPLDRDVSIAGDVRALLYASTTGTDADWVVKLIDVYPDTVPERPRMGGYELMVAGDVMRGRYRRSFEHAEPIPANTVLPFTVDLHQQAYTFRRGHRIMVQVQSTWFPLYDRNPQTFVPNIFRAAAGDYRARTHRIVRSAAQPSHVQVMVLPPG